MGCGCVYEETCWMPTAALPLISIHMHRSCSYLFNNIHNFDSYLHISLYLNNIISHIASSWDAWAVNHLQKCAIFAASVSPWPLITFLLLPCSPSSPYQRPSLLIQHASMVTFSHECPGNPPHLLFKSMQITTSKSSRASSETELCTCGEDWTSEGGGGVTCTPLHFSLILSYVYVMLLFKRSHTFF